MMTSEQKGLRFAAFVTLSTGLLLALAALPALNLPVRILADILIWPLDGGQGLGAPETRLPLAISGGVMLGWGVMIWQLAGRPMETAPDAMRAIIRTSLLAWFVVDSLASVAAGAALNIVANAAFLALFLIPMRIGARQRAAWA
jgi:hypothetical protein